MAIIKRLVITMMHSRQFAFLVAIGSVACTSAEEGGDGTGLGDDASDSPSSAVDLTQDGAPQYAEPTCHNLATCCPAGTVAVFGTAFADNMSTSAPAICQLALGGADNVLNASASGLHAVLAGPGNDNVQGGYGKGILAGGSDADNLRGRASDDELYGQAGNDSLEGGAGNDRVSGGSEPDILVGGPGADSVDGGSGNDHVYIHDLCELAPGELLNGRDGTDTLHSPIPASQLGVSVSNFESYVIEASPEDSMCDACGCEYVAGEGIVCCNGRGTCDVANENGDMVCDCDPGYAGEDCSYDVAETFFDDLPPACDEPGVACSATYAANDAHLANFDLTASGECDDLELLAEQPLYDILVTYPADEAGEWIPGLHPFVLFGAGNKYDETHYENLSAHLARSGFVVAAISPSPLPPVSPNLAPVGHRGEALHCLRRLLPGLELVAGEAPLGDHHDLRVSYAGHSRGGEAAVIATSLDAGQHTPGPNTVISIAPTAFCSSDQVEGDCGYDDLDIANALGRLDDGETPAFLVMQGSQDGDPSGRGVTLFDVAAKEHVDEVAGGLVTPPANAMVKAMKWIDNVPHGDWLDQAPFLSAQPADLLASTFGLAFLEWHMSEYTSRRGLFTGAASDPCVADPSSCGFGFPAPVISSQYREAGSDAGARRAVVRYFSEAFASPEGIGGAATKSGAVAQVIAAEAGPREWIRGRALELEVSGAKTSWVELGLARQVGATAFPTDAIAEGFSHLSLRLVRTIPDDIVRSLPQTECDAAAAEHTTPLSVRVTLQDADGIKGLVHTSDVTPVLPAHIGWTLSEGGDHCEAVSFWTTVRIPLGDFAGVDLRALSKVRITLDGSDFGGEPMAALLDSVELLGHDLDGFCGDGVINGPEECDGEDLGGASCEALDLIGTVECTSSCALDTSDCIDCVAGDTGCNCLDEAVDGMHPQGPLPGNGSLGDGHYCADDVVFGGTTRCVQDGDAFRCEQCTVGDGVFCPCVPGNGCIGGTECHFACHTAPCEEETMALQYGYCFYDGQDPEDGGVPLWFFDSYCALYWDDFECRNTLEAGNVCVEAPGDGGSCVL